MASGPAGPTEILGPDLQLFTGVHPQPGTLGRGGWGGPSQTPLPPLSEPPPRLFIHPCPSPSKQSVPPPPPPEHQPLGPQYPPGHCAFLRALLQLHLREGGGHNPGCPGICTLQRDPVPPKPKACCQTSSNGLCHLQVRCLHRFIRRLGCRSNMSDNPKWCGLATRNATLHPSHAIPNCFCVWLVYCKSMGTCIGAEIVCPCKSPRPWGRTVIWVHTTPEYGGGGGVLPYFHGIHTFPWKTRKIDAPKCTSGGYAPFNLHVLWVESKTAEFARSMSTSPSLCTGEGALGVVVRVLVRRCDVVWRWGAGALECCGTRGD